MDGTSAPANLSARAGSPRQALLVSVEREGSPDARAVLFEKEAGEWVRVLGPMRAVGGRSGFAPEGLKREGDGRTPTGVYPLDLVFGYGPSAPTRMAYRQATVDDIWVDDATSPDYNRWVRRGATAAGSFEEMRRPDDLYAYGIVVEYNTNPVVPGHGSAIFVHIWKGEGVATSGCVAMAEEDLLAVIGRLDPALRPVIAIGVGER
jgi:L,D-peptidoglycan transpeptidase YkuD (ErfK/YbiS/YcfS/YnhG family)